MAQMFQTAANNLSLAVASADVAHTCGTLAGNSGCVICAAHQ
ncbi:hypothetical protein LPU83_pLPU83c_0498 (plasmid) [Rhizobium favelukesii]|uniref:Uncharacterized protein n=1 Tax=Rhizobium favelukesii TaxID=348824 RepID=W6RLD7_9HYPH|nr:hypothetical protein LPU83_pLPU83c_0498 [Rhizobium favelukesii]